MRSIKHIFVSIAALLAVIGTSFSKTYSIAPNDTFKTSGMMEDQQTLTISQLNTSSNTITLEWEKISESVPVSWEASVCDNRICYAILQDTGTMNPVAPSETGFLLLHITGHVNYGTAVIRYAVWDINNPALKDTLTYILTVDQNSGIAETNNNKIFTVYPNPTKDQINIASGFQAGFTYSVINLTGEEVQSGHSEVNSVIFSTGNFPSGIYFLKLTPVDSGIDNKFFIQKIIIQ